MKKIDLHIHTISSVSDTNFEFSMAKLEEYVEKLAIDCIAITNHNLFDLEQFRSISSALTIDVLPGIEIDVEKGHLLLIADNGELEDFAAKCRQVSEEIPTSSSWITVETLKQIFSDLNKYLIIPHYDKKPSISEQTLSKLSPYIVSGEVTSARKFRSCAKDDSKLTPVIFSDIRISDDLTIFPIRQTFVDLSTISVRGLKHCLADKGKVCLSKDEGNSFFQVTDDGLFLSTGLNIVLGERSSGKTYTLNRIIASFDNFKYIRQFSLLQNDEEKFKDLLSTRNGNTNEEFLKEFKDVIADVAQIDLRSSKNEVERYVSSLLKFASESDKLDSFSKATLFGETSFSESDLKGLERLIDATTLLIDNLEYREIIDRHVSQDALKALAVDLIKKHTIESENNFKKRWINGIVTKIKGELRLRTSTIPPTEIDFYNIMIENEKIKKFIQIATNIKREKEIDRKEIRGFKIIAKTVKFSGAQQLKNKSGRMLSFADAFQKYDNPYAFLNALKEIELSPADYFKFFVDIEYQTLNKHNFPVSGGERSEFNLLHEISDALQYDILLIDEPESSFDNLFLKNDVNGLLKEISSEIPVVVVTHNSTVGASIKPDYVVYTKKAIEGNEIVYKLFHGYPSDKELRSLNGDVIDNYEVLLNCLEAGDQAYTDRRHVTYEVLKN